MGAAAYADDLLLKSPTTNGLNTMLSICGKYAASHDITFNATKSQFISFGNKGNVSIPPPIYTIGGSAICNTDVTSYTSGSCA